jgi:hypothetical protein
MMVLNRGEHEAFLIYERLAREVPPTCLEERRQLEPQLAFWSEFASAYAAQVHTLCASVTAVYLPFFVFGRVLTRQD